MKRGETKARLTITIDPDILAKAKRLAEEKHIPVSGVIENFLDFFVNPKVYCIVCGEKFSSDEAELCPICGWMKCAKCGACKCRLNEDVATAVFHMRRVYEDLLAGRVKRD